MHTTTHLYHHLPKNGGKKIAYGMFCANFEVNTSGAPLGLLLGLTQLKKKSKEKTQEKKCVPGQTAVLGSHRNRSARGRHFGAGSHTADADFALGIYCYIAFGNFHGHCNDNYWTQGHLGLDHTPLMPILQKLYNVHIL